MRGAATVVDMSAPSAANAVERERAEVVGKLEEDLSKLSVAELEKLLEDKLALVTAFFRVTKPKKKHRRLTKSWLTTNLEITLVVWR